ncbi:MAG: class I SAM-dependent RNA methyltransferase [Thermomicrobiales bacterium]|nr:class I SAM-dependent RNA methyltransferase [Thermomicrobiales bacterium]
MTHRTTPDITLDVTIDRIVGDGKGIGFANGKTIFVSRTAPGDHVRARVIRANKNVLHAVPEKIYTPSPMRITPDVEYAERAGAYDFIHINYPDQLKLKIGIIEDSLRRIAKLEIWPEINIIASPQQFGYRSRAEFQVSAENSLVGYFAENSNVIVDVPRCPLCNDTVNMLLQTLRDDVEAGLVPATAREYRAVAGDFGTALEQTTTQRSATLQQRVGEFDYRFSAECFFQANHGIAEELVKGVMRIATQARAENGYAVDLYAGVGLFSLPLAKLFKRVLAVESHKPAIAFLKENLEHAGYTRSKVISTPVEHWVQGDVSKYGRVAMMVFDPPRTGAGAKAIDGMITMNPAHIAAVSCDPATFARDLAGLIDGGYQLVNITAYDMFPQTHHVEILAHLKRADV